MVTGAMDMILTSEFGNASFCALELQSDTIDAGTLMLEAIFTVSCPAPKYLQLPRYLAESTVRIVVDNTGKNLSNVISHASMNSHAVHVNKRTTQELIQHARPQIQTLVDIAVNLSKPQQNKMIQQAQTLMMAEAKEDIERLRALADVNPNIRKEEVETLENNATALASYLEQARLKLDSIRVALVTK